LVLPEFAWLGEKTTGLARASCSTKEHIRAIDGSAPVEKASNLHAGPCAGLRWPKERWLRMLFVSQLPLAWPSQGRESMVIDVHPNKFRKNRIFWVNTFEQNP